MFTGYHRRETHIHDDHRLGIQGNRNPDKHATDMGATLWVPTTRANGWGPTRLRETRRSTPDFGARSHCCRPSPAAAVDPDPRPIERPARVRNPQAQANRARGTVRARCMENRCSQPRRRHARLRPSTGAQPPRHAAILGRLYRALCALAWSQLGSRRNCDPSRALCVRAGTDCLG
jgi:hypothetical protein